MDVGAIKKIMCMPGEEDTQNINKDNIKKKRKNLVNFKGVPNILLLITERIRQTWCAIPWLEF